MIKSKKDYLYYLECDRVALKIRRKKPRIIGDDIWKFQRLMRKREYIENCKKNIFFRSYSIFLKYLYIKKGIKLGFSIPINVFGPGLSIAHYGTIVVNGASKVGANCRIHEGVTIGATGGSKLAPTLGDNVFLGSGSKVIGNITIANGIAVGANSVVVKSFFEQNITIAGVPAKKISDNNSEKLIGIDNSKIENKKNSCYGFGKRVKNTKVK